MNLRSGSFAAYLRDFAAKIYETKGEFRTGGGDARELIAAAAELERLAVVEQRSEDAELVVWGILNDMLRTIDHGDRKAWSWWDDKTQEHVVLNEAFDYETGSTFNALPPVLTNTARAALMAMRESG